MDRKDRSIFEILKPYSKQIIILIFFALLSNAINLLIPWLISVSIDSFRTGAFNYRIVLLQFVSASLVIFIFVALQSIIQTIVSEKVARDLRLRLVEKLSKQSYSYIQQVNPSKLLTNLTSDIDSIKLFVSMGIVSIFSSIFMIIGSSVLLIRIEYKLAIPVLLIIPIIGIGFFVVLKRVRSIFVKSREVIDWLNKIINESILGAALVRVLNSQTLEYNKFIDANSKAKEFGLSILKLFATLIPMVMFVSNLAYLIILVLGGHFVQTGEMSVGQIAAFNSYLVILIFPIIIIGFMSNIMAQSSASYKRICEVLYAPEQSHSGTIQMELDGSLQVNNVTLMYGDKNVLNNVSFNVQPSTYVALIGPTAAGKSQLFLLLAGLTKPTEGEICFNGMAIPEFDIQFLQQQIGFVFQDSLLFNVSLKDNIALNANISEIEINKAIKTAELEEYVDSLPDGLETIVSERGTSLSGGQKQRIMLARALASNPKILLLDDFTSRVDNKTEKSILLNIKENYPLVTVISITQKISNITDYDNIVLLMDGELIAQGTHQSLIETSTEYNQIYNSQRSTNYELQA